MTKRKGVRVNFVLPYKIYGGAEKAATNLAEKLISAGFEVRIISLPDVFKKIDSGNVLIRILLLKILLILKGVNKRNPDKTILLGEYGILCSNSIVWVHGSYKGYYESAGIKINIFKSVLIYFQKKAIRRASEVVFVSKYLSEIYDLGKGSIIWNINHTILTLSVERKRNKILWIFGNSNPREKGLELILELIKEGYDITSIGNVSIKVLNNDTQFYDHHELMDLIASSRLVLMPSLFEANSMILRESWALETPVLTSRVGIYQELLELSLSDYVVSYPTKEEWMRKIDEVLQKSIDLIRTDSQRLNNYYTNDEIVNEWVKILNKG